MDTTAIGAVARRSRAVTERDIALFTEITGDRNPIHYDRRPRRGEPVRRTRRPGRA